MTSTDPTLIALNAEWEALTSRSAPLVARWAAAEPDLAGSRDLAGVLELIRQRPDPVLLALLRLGADGDPTAHRAVLQTMLGKLVLLTAGRPGQLAEAVSELWLAISDYPVDRRPRAIACNLAWAVRRRLAAVPQPPPPPPDVGRDGPEAAAVLGRARRLGLIDEPTHRTLWAVYIDGMTSAEAGRALGTSAGAVRWRCSQALRRLASRAELLAA